jgi:preprotein translocase SecE subunit
MANQTKANTNFNDKLVTFFKSVKQEWAKISWPSKADVIRETILVIVITAVFTIGVLALDVILDALFKFLHLK